MFINPITKTDYPDPDVIRVGDTYYMISTTMYFMPGGVILRSYDLVNWEIATYIFDHLDDSDREKLVGDENCYGAGMWAACIRYHEGRFYVAFVSHGMDYTHLFVADDIEGPWEQRKIEGYYHDCSLLFDDDGRVFIVSGNTEIRLTELNHDLTGPKKGGIDKIIIKDNPKEVRLGYEGAHFYKINDRYYITLIHWPNYNGRRTEAVFWSDTVDGEYIGKDVIWDDMAYHNMGVAQGGLVDTPDGRWFAMLFQDSGAVGRVPVLVPVVWKETLSDNYKKSLKRMGEDGPIPIFGEGGMVPFNPRVTSTRPDYKYEKLYTSDDFAYEGEKHPVLKKQWQWNHVPDMDNWEIQDKTLRITTGKICNNPVLTRNTLTQRMMLPGCRGSVTIDGTNLKNGDMAGLIALQGCYGMIGISKDEDKLYLTVLVRTKIEKPFEIGYTDMKEGEVLYREELVSQKRVTVRLTADFLDMHDLLDFEVLEENCWKKVGESHQLRFGLDHFTGARFGLNVFSTKNCGGMAGFSDFVYEVLDEEEIALLR